MKVSHADGVLHVTLLFDRTSLNPEKESRMESFEGYVAKTLGVKLPEEYAMFMVNF